jgi:ATP-dependent RNA helicase DeaD
MRRALDLADIRAIVLDEADEMLDLGFREDLEFMLGEAPADRRTLMFSATVPPAIAELAKQYQRDAVRVTTVSRGTQHADIAYQVVQVAQQDAEHAIINLLRYHDAPTAIVFANTRAAVSRLAARFANRGLSVVSLSGELSQDERSHALQAMRDGRARVCVATDVAARGIDLPKLDLVIHADLPTNTEALLHRSGRTGRAGRKGISAMIVPDKVTNKASRLLKFAKIQAEWVFAPTADEILALDETRLLSDALWTAPLTDTETAFAARILAEQSPEQIAAACLRLYRAGLSAPEDLNAPGTPAPRKEHVAFGPSVWFELSVGQGRRAEARWLLPLLCRAGNLDKAHIGKIRIQADTSLVELAETAVPGFLAQIGPDGVLEDDVTARQIDGVPDVAPQARAPRPDRAPYDKPDRAPRAPKPYTPRDDAPRPPRPDRADRPARPADAAPAQDRPVRPSAYEKPAYAKPARAPYDKPARAPYDKAPRKDGASAPAGKPDYKASKPYKPRDASPGAAPARTGGKPPYAKGPARDDARGGAGPKDGPRKPRGADGKKEWVKPVHNHKPADAGPTGPRAGATDTSKRMERPGAKPRTPGKPTGSGRPSGPGGKPFGPGGGGKPPRKGGGAPPRRKG